MDPAFLNRNVNEGFSGWPPHVSCDFPWVALCPVRNAERMALTGAPLGCVPLARLRPAQGGCVFALTVVTRFCSRLPGWLTAGGEKKRNEILQLACLEADMAILDEIDSGVFASQ